VLFESLTGMPPFSGDIHSMITSHLTKPPPRLSEARTDLPPAIDAVLEKAMAKEPADRYQTGHEFAEAARRALLSSGLPPPSTPPPPPPPTAPPVPTSTPTGPVPAATAGYSSGAFSTPPPGGLPSATPAGGSGGGSKAPLIIGGVVVLLLLVVGGALLLGGGGDDSGDDGGSPTTDTVDENAEALDAAQTAFDDLPDGLDHDQCELDEDVGDYDDGVVAQADCEPDEGADEVSVTVFDDAEALGSAFADVEDESAEELSTEEDCQTSHYATHTWTSTDEPDAVLGQVACYLTDDDQAGLAWTLDDQNLLYVAHRSDGDDAPIYNWWIDLVDRAAPDDSADFPNDDESELLAHVPSDFRDTCVRAELRPREIASVQCTPNRGASVVFYNAYPTPQGATAQYEVLRGANDVPRNSGDTNTCPHEAGLTIDDVSTGRVFCAYNDAGDAILVWSNRALAIQTEATIAPGATIQDFWDWWTTAGPS
jgi:hypothetical protein